MAAIDSLIDKIEDIDLRTRIKAELHRIQKQRKFGIVYEEHLPEATLLYDVPIKKGTLVTKKSDGINGFYRVLNVDGKEVLCVKLDETHAEEILPKDELVAVAQFGEAIYPYLKPMDSICNAPDSKLWHTLIEADNYHALQLLCYLYEGMVDCIYIDPPYNTGAKDWKYNNDYVDNTDLYRHSKWLSMMEKRLRLAKKLLNPNDSLLMITIDDIELATLRLLIDNIFSGCFVQIVDVVINPKGKARPGKLSQVDEYLLLIYIGNAKTVAESTMSANEEVRWPYLRRSDVESARGTKKGGVKQFYPIYVDKESQKIVKLGDYLTPEQPLSDAPEVEGAVCVFPIRDDGKQMNWGLTADSLQYAIDNGCVRVTQSTNPNQAFNFSYVTMPSIKKALDGTYLIEGTREDGTKIITIPNGKESQKLTAWKNTLYDANAYGTKLISKFLIDKRFSFPKSLYCVRDTLKMYLDNKPKALVVDFFAGSGTTLHAINLLNAEDGGQRRCIMVTNNEIGEQKETELKAKGICQGDEEWEKWGIARYVNWARTKCSILGQDINGKVIDGEYITSLTETMTVDRHYTHINYLVDAPTLKQKKALVTQINKQDGVKLPTIKEDLPYLVSEEEDYNASILFEDSLVDNWLEALNENSHITNFYIVTSTDSVYNRIKKAVGNLMGKIEEIIPIKTPIKNGFKTNAAYFKLSFLDKTSVSLGRKFTELLPVLWMKAGAKGECPTITGEPDYIILPNNNFAVLINDYAFAEFTAELKKVSGIEVVFINTDSEDGYREMISKLNIDNTYQLYRDYLDNFTINYAK